jgi:hypothetical protein
VARCRAQSRGSRHLPDQATCQLQVFYDLEKSLGELCDHRSSSLCFPPHACMKRSNVVRAAAVHLACSCSCSN